jgi:class 3 adenylate cyclase
MRYPTFHYRWDWQLHSSPEQLWPLITDTNRFNRDTGLPTVHRIAQDGSENARQRLWFSRFGVRLEWDEEPFEWVRPARFGVVRRYRRGPVAEMRVAATLTPGAKSGTHLRYETWVRPRSLFGLLVVPPGMTLVNRWRFGRTFQHYDRLAPREDRSLVEVADVGHPADLPPGAKERLAEARNRLAAQTGDATVAEQLVQAVEQLDDLTLRRLRPYALADAWAVPRRQVLESCLHATRDGLFDLQWDILCPLCRGAKATSSSLNDVGGTVHCDVCNIDFTANLDRSVELTFRPSPAVRPIEAASYCVGGPQVTPHIVAQQLLAPGAERTLTIPLEAGRYRIRALGHPGGQYLDARSGGADRATLSLTESGWPEAPVDVSRSPTLQLVNATRGEHLVILERMAWSDQAVTAAEVTTLQVFRDLFSSELIRPGEEISIGSLTILFTDLRDSTSFYRRVGDAPAFARVLDHFTVLRTAVDGEDGAVVKTIGDAIMAVFRRPAQGLRATLAAQERLAESPSGGSPLYLKAGLHHGPCIAVTMNDRLDYFGSTVNLAARLDRFSTGNDVIISDAVRNDPEVAAFLAAQAGSLALEPFDAPLKGFEEDAFRLWRVIRLSRTEASLEATANRPAVSGGRGEPSP